MVVFFQRSVANYREKFLLSLECRLRTPLHLLVSNDANVEGLISADHEELKVSITQMPTYYWGPFIFQSLKPFWRCRHQARVVVLEDNSRILTNLAVALICYMNGKPIVLWGHGESARNRLSKRRLRIGWVVRRFLLMFAAHYLAYTESSRTSLIDGYGFADSKITVFNNTLPVNEVAHIQEAQNHKQFNRNVKTIAFIGRVVPEKGIHEFLAVASHSQSLGKSYRFIVIGPCERAPLLKLMHEQRNVTYCGEINDLFDLHRALFDVDLLLCLGFCGLNINQALAAGCPVITVPDGKNSVFHSPEFSYLVDEKNCRITEANPKDVLDAICEIEEDYECYQSNSFRTANTLQFRQMVETVAKTLDSLS